MIFDYRNASIKQHELAEFLFGIKNEKKRAYKQMTGAKMTSHKGEQN